MKKVARKSNLRKVLLFDPSGTTNYCNGLADELCKITQLTVVARDNFSAENEKDFTCHRWFNSNQNKFAKGTGYIIGWLRTLLLERKEQFDMIHIQWLLVYQIDIFFLHLLKKQNVKIIYTAHNVIPHVRGEKRVRQLYRIYSLVDLIVVHGQASKEELLHFFPEISEKKIFFQKHGITDSSIKNAAKTKKSNSVRIQKIDSAKGKIILYLGVIFENKGVDRLFTFWNTYAAEHPNDIMVICGKVTETSTQYEELANQFIEIENALYMPEVVPTDIHDYLYDKADVVVLPYRHASMSGCVFAAAEYATPILATNTGCIPEYLHNGEDCFIAENNDDSVYEALKTVLDDYTKEELHQMGESLHRNIIRSCNWTSVSNELLRIYEKNGDGA